MRKYGQRTELKWNKYSIQYIANIGRHMSKGDKNVKKTSTNRVF